LTSFPGGPTSIEKLEVKHHVSQEEAEEVFYNGAKYRFVESDIVQARMYTQQVGRLTADAI
jgi:hypothetical protein